MQFYKESLSSERILMVQILYFNQWCINLQSIFFRMQPRIDTHQLMINSPRSKIVNFTHFVKISITQHFKQTFSTSETKLQQLLNGLSLMRVKLSRQKQYFLISDLEQETNMMSQTRDMLKVLSECLDYHDMTKYNASVEWISKLDNASCQCKSIEEDIRLLSISIGINKMSMVLFPMENQYLIKEWIFRKALIGDAIQQFKQALDQIKKDKNDKQLLKESHPRMLIDWLLISEALLSKIHFYESKRYESILKSAKGTKELQNAFFAFKKFRMAYESIISNQLLDTYLKNKISGYLLEEFHYFSILFYFEKGQLSSIDQNLKKICKNSFLLAKRAYVNLKSKNIEFANRMEVSQIYSKIEQKLGKNFNQEASADVQKQILDQMNSLHEQQINIAEKTDEPWKQRLEELRYMLQELLLQQKYNQMEEQLQKHCKDTQREIQSFLLSTQKSFENSQINYYLGKSKICNSISPQILFIITEVQKLKCYSSLAIKNQFTQLDEKLGLIQMLEYPKIQKLKGKNNALKKKFEFAMADQIKDEEFKKLLEMVNEGENSLRKMFKMDNRNRVDMKELQEKYQIFKERKKMLINLKRNIENRECLTIMKEEFKSQDCKQRDNLQIIVDSHISLITEQFQQIKQKVNQVATSCQNIAKIIKTSENQSAEKKAFTESEKKLLKLKEFFLRYKRIFEDQQKLLKHFIDVYQKNNKTSIHQFLIKVGKQQSEIYINEKTEQSIWIRGQEVGNSGPMDESVMSISNISSEYSVRDFLRDAGKN